MFFFTDARASRLCCALAAIALSLPLLNGQQSLNPGAFVVVGDSLSAGFQNFSLNETGQPHGYAAVVARQAGANLVLPMVSYPGIPPALTMSSGQIVRAAGIGFREDPLLQTYNLSVPGFTVANAIAYPFPGDPLLNPIDALSDTILSVPGTTFGCGPIFTTIGLAVSEVTCAVALKPNTILVALGNNDALQALTFGLPPTDTATFTANYNQVMATLAATGAKLVVTNIPNVTDIPFLVPIPAFEAVCPNPAPPLPSTVTSADFVVVNITNPFATSFSICTNYAVRSAALIASSAQAVTAFNSVIAATAHQYGAALVDFNGLFAGVAQNGYMVNGHRLTTAFLGGLFSLDGIHPTNTGYAILANEVIKTMNRQFNTNISPISVVQVFKTDPLVP